MNHLWEERLVAFLRPSKHQVVWRGIRGDWSRNYPKERKFTWWALTSCTLSLDVLQSSAYLGKSGPRTLFNVETKSGKSIKHHSYFAAEDEVLLPPGIYLEVISQLSSSKDLCIIHLREVTPPYKLVHDPFNLNERPQLINSYGSRQQSVSVTSTPKSQRKSHHKTLESRRRNNAERFFC